MFRSRKFYDIFSLSLAQDVISHDFHELTSFLHHALTGTIVWSALVEEHYSWSLNVIVVSQV